MEKSLKNSRGNSICQGLGPYKGLECYGRNVSSKKEERLLSFSDSSKSITENRACITHSFILLILFLLKVLL